MPQINNKDDLYVITINSLKEQEELHNFCITYNIPVLYEELFKDKKLHHLWGVSNSGLALVGTLIARHTPKDHIVNDVKDLKTLLF